MPLPLRACAAAGVVIAAVLSGPAAAEASTIYPPSGACTVSPAAASAGATISLSCAAATFSANEPVTITVTGENGDAASIGFIKTAISTASGRATSDADGSLKPVSITLPRDASGTYNIAVVSPTSVGGTATATIAAADGSLPVTGMNSGSLLSLWVGGGALVLAGGTIAAAVAVRRHRERTDI